jgi:hypothetical protein
VQLSDRLNNYWYLCSHLSPNWLYKLAQNFVLNVLELIELAYSGLVSVVSVIASFEKHQGGNSEFNAQGLPVIRHDTQHNDTQRKEPIGDTQHKWHKA